MKDLKIREATTDEETYQTELQIFVLKLMSQIKLF